MVKRSDDAGEGYGVEVCWVSGGRFTVIFFSFSFMGYVIFGPQLLARTDSSMTKSTLIAAIVGVQHHRKKYAGDAGDDSWELRVSGACCRVIIDCVLLLPL